MATLLKIDRFYNLKEITKVEFEECRVSSLDFHESGGFGLSVSHFFFNLIFIIDLLTISIQLLYSNRFVWPPHRMMMHCACAKVAQKMAKN